MVDAQRRLTSSLLEVGKRYTKADIYKTLAVPSERQGGAWDTGYREYGGDCFVFANVGVPGRTGHDYPNRWVPTEQGGEVLKWKGKTSSRLGQPLVQQLLNPAGEVLIFWRAHNEDPFLFAGPARAMSYEDTVPVTITWAFEDVGSPLLEEAALAELAARQAGRRHGAAGQGMRITAAEARAIENRAMLLAIAELTEDGWLVEDVSRHRSFDLFCTRASEMLHVEVKGTKGLGESVLLTANEVEFARAHKGTMALYVVGGIATELTPDGWQASGGVRAFYTKWSPEPERLAPVGFRYTVPARPD